MNAPTCPNIGTLPSRTSALLLQGQAITHQDFWLHAGTYRLSALTKPISLGGGKLYRAGDSRMDCRANPKKPEGLKGRQ